MKNLYHLFGGDAGINSGSKIQISYCGSGEIKDNLINKKRKASRKKERIEDKKGKNKKNENFILIFLTNLINVYKYKKLCVILKK